MRLTSVKNLRGTSPEEQELSEPAASWQPPLLDVVGPPLARRRQKSSAAAAWMGRARVKAAR